MDCCTPGFPVHHQLSELAQTHVHRVGDAIQPSHPLLSPSPAFNLSQVVLAVKHPPAKEETQEMQVPSLASHSIPGGGEDALE